MDREISDWAPRGLRRPARLVASAQWADGTSSPVVVTNLSYSGCRLAPEQRFVRGETVRLVLPELGQVDAHIRWVRNGKAGARFLTGDSAKDARRARIGV
jgi:hypothetical protein